jgi:hypothetical protein
VAGEAALYKGKYPAFLHHLYFIQEALKFEVTGYYYHPHYFSVLGRSFGSFQAPPANSMGVAMILLYKAGKKIHVGGYYYQFRKIQDLDENPFNRHNYLLGLYFNQKRHAARLQWKYKIYEGDDRHEPLKNKQIIIGQLQYTNKSFSHLMLRTNCELHWGSGNFDGGHYPGINIYQQLEWIFPKWRFVARWSNFDIPTYDLRIYEYETDLPGNFRSLLLNGRGNKIFFILRWIPGDRVQWDLKYGQRYYPDQETIGAGLDRISHNRLHEIKMSLIWKIFGEKK